MTTTNPYIKTRHFTIYPCCGGNTWFDIWFDEPEQRFERQCIWCWTKYTVTAHNDKGSDGIPTVTRFSWEAYNYD